MSNKKIKKVLLITIVSVIVLAAIVTLVISDEPEPIPPEITYTENTVDYRYSDNTGNIIIYSAPRFHQDSNNNWVNVSDVFRITKNEDDIIFHYDGNLGNFSVTFESGIMTVGDAYLSMSQVKQNYPQVQFSFPTKQTPTMRKYAVNITNVPAVVQPAVDSVTLTYKEHTGFTLEQFLSANERFNIKGIMQLGFQDLLDEGFTIFINKSEKRIYISNLTFVDDSLYLDPSIKINDTEIGNMADIDSDDSFFTNVQLQIKFNISSVPESKTIDSAEICLFVTSVDGSPDDDLTVWRVDDQSWDETISTGDYDSQSTTDEESKTLSSIIDDTKTCFDVTTQVTVDYSASNTFATIRIEDPDNQHDGGSASIQDETGLCLADLDICFQDREFAIGEPNSFSPYLNITYSTAAASSGTNRIIIREDGRIIIRDTGVLRLY